MASDRVRIASKNRSLGFASPTPVSWLCCALIALAIAPQLASAESDGERTSAETVALSSLPYEFLERFKASTVGSLYKIAFDAANPFYLTGDFDGDGAMDYVLRLHAKANSDVEEDVVFFAKGEARLLSSDIKEELPGPAWYVVPKKERPGLQGDAIMLVRPESSAALVTWNGKSFELAWEGD